MPVLFCRLGTLPCCPGRPDYFAVAEEARP